jgi:hypothetical protein
MSLPFDLGDTMTDGIFVNHKRPQSKKAVKDAIATDPESVMIEDTSIFPGGFSGPVSDWPVGKTITFVGPDPYTSRKFYGNIVRTAKGLKVT